MPFDFKAYDAKCNALTPEELQREWQHYTRLISGASTSTAVSGLALPLTCGVSAIGVGLAAPAIHNARKKREIIEKHLNKHGTTHNTRKRDVIGSVAFSGTIGVVTLGVGTLGADAIVANGAEHGITAIAQNELAVKVVTHAAMDGAAIGIEHMHTSHTKKKEAVKAFQSAGVFQAVADAKAAEAGYGPQQQQQFAYGPGGNLAPYDASLNPPPVGFVSDAKAPAGPEQVNYPYPYTPDPAAAAQQPAVYHYGPAQPAYQQAQPAPGAYTAAAAVPQDPNAQPVTYPAYGVPPEQYAAQTIPPAPTVGDSTSREVGQNTSAQIPTCNGTTQAYAAGTSTYDMKPLADALPSASTTHTHSAYFDPAAPYQANQEPHPQATSAAEAQPKELSGAAVAASEPHQHIVTHDNTNSSAVPPAQPAAQPTVENGNAVMYSSFSFQSFDHYELPGESATRGPAPTSDQPGQGAQPAAEPTQPIHPAVPEPQTSYFDPQPTAHLAYESTGASGYSTQTTSSTASHTSASTYATECPTPMTTYSYPDTPLQSSVSACATPYQGYQSYNPQDYAAVPTNNLPPAQADPVGGYGNPAVAPGAAPAAGYGQPQPARQEYHYRPAIPATSAPQYPQYPQQAQPFQPENAPFQAYQPAQEAAGPSVPQHQTTYPEQGAYVQQQPYQNHIPAQQPTYQVPAQQMAYQAPVQQQAYQVPVQQEAYQAPVQQQEYQAQPVQHQAYQPPAPAQAQPQPPPQQEGQYQAYAPSNPAPQAQAYGQPQAPLGQTYAPPTAWS
ncbi:unnamed protein product [Parascedosporium putredinis]|uniref:Uncharacterized protein n=1 Tax=Parascedosporium putredinis TaxID=1442378 RepID=A0A9P1GY34_9PEZI|nr:unnamed protein product [Parascedosporium putredinis]CAI7989586.1 unnamed protein product [Parascedosporium putredinis]